MSNGWVPEAGDTILIQFNPQAEHEQAGHRPALVLSSADYNRLTGLLLCVPMTTQAKGLRFEVGIGSAEGIALSDQIKSFDWRARNAKRKGRATGAELEAVRARARALIG